MRQVAKGPEQKWIGRVAQLFILPKCLVGQLGLAANVRLHEARCCYGGVRAAWTNRQCSTNAAR